VDGSPELYAYGTDDANKILIIGERRGGTSYTVLDISSHTVPLFKYAVSASILGGGTKQLGQSWGTPNLATVKDGTTSKDVFIMSGGYDTNQDNLSLSAADDEGRAVFAIDAATGALQSNINFNVDNFSAMTHSIIAVSAFENPKSRTTTRIYAGDLGGNLFGFRDDIFHHNKDVAKAADYEGNYDGREDGNWGQKLKLFSSGGGRKIMYAPNILSAYFKTDITYPDLTVKKETRVGDYLFYGTGDREHPDDVTITNEFYAIKNNWQWNDNTATTSVDESIAPSIVKAYVDDADGQIKAEDDDRVLVASQRDGDGHYISNVAGNGELFILNVTDDLLQNKETVEETATLYTNYIKDAIKHPNNRGWYFTFADAGEKIVSTPIIFGGVVYFTTFVPEAASTSTSDPCANPGARGTGYLYAIGYKYGDAVIDFDSVTSPDELHREDRRKKLSGKGIPPEPVLVIHEGKPTIIAGFDTVDPAFSQSVEQFYWRQINN
jgi:type IV pilus assembly protein PilY1